VGPIQNIDTRKGGDRGFGFIAPRFGADVCLGAPGIFRDPDTLLGWSSPHPPGSLADILFDILPTSCFA